MILTTNQFFAHCEQTGQDDLAQHLCDNFIKSMKMLNPDMKHMLGSDWLSVLLNDFYITIDGGELQIIPNNNKPDCEVYTTFNV